MSLPVKTKFDPTLPIGEGGIKATQSFRDWLVSLDRLVAAQAGGTLPPVTAINVASDGHPISGGIFVGNNAPSGDDSANLVGRNLAPASGLLNSHAFRDETVATENVTGGQFSGYASFDSAPQINGLCTTPQNHLHGFQARGIYNATGTLTEWAGFTAQPTVSGAGSLVANSYGFFVLNASIVAGGITNQYAYYANPLSGATNSYFLYQGAPGNPSVLSGNLYVGGLTSQVSVEITNVKFNGALQQGTLFYDSNAAAGSGSAIAFYRNTTAVGSITTTLTATAFNTSSDERLKKFTGRFDPKEAIRIIRADPVRAFTWEATGEAAVGWGAQTSHAISSDLATPGDGDPAKRPGDKGFAAWGVDQGRRTPYLWAALSDALDRIDLLETRLAKLEAVR